MPDPYKVPTMEEVRAIEPNGFLAASTFSGCGGSSLGYRMAGYKVGYANEFIPEARNTYAANAMPYTFVDGRDIRTVTAADVLEKLGIKAGALDLFDGSPPCASFSTSGSGSKGWGNVRKYCVAPKTRVLMADLRWKRADEVEAKDAVIGFEEEKVRGAKSRRFKTTYVEVSSVVYRPTLRLTFDDGTEVECSEEHRWLAGAPSRGGRSEGSGRNQRWRFASSLRIGDNVMKLSTPWDEDESKEAGWLAGMFDGEGCLTPRCLSVAQISGPIRDRLVKELRARGYDTGGAGFSTHVKGGVGERLRFLGQVRPFRLLAKAEKHWDGVAVSAARRVRVVSIKKLGNKKLIALSTLDKTFIAEGLLSHNSDTEQRTDDLFFEFLRLVDGIRPKTFVAENVAGLVRGVAVGYFNEILEQSKKLGYRVNAKVLDAQWLGVPQQRTRIIFVGVREDLGLDPAHPEPFDFRYSLGDACPWMLDGSDGPEPRDGPDISRYAIGPEWEKCREGEQSDRYFNLIRASRTKPSPTILASHGAPGIAGVCHPTEKRKFSIPEVRRVCSFPDDFALTGSREQQWERMGRAVPPLMMRAIGAAVRDKVLIPYRELREARKR